MTEQELIRRAKAGDSRAFERLMQDNETRIYNLALRMTGSPEDALDLSQEAFLNAWRGLASFRGNSAFSTWLYRLAMNVCVDFLRSEVRRREAIGAALSLEEGAAPAEDERLGPYARLERQEERELLRQALEALPLHHRQVLVLRELSGLSYQEISQALDLDLGTVKSRIARARLALRKILLESGNFFAPEASKKTSEHRREARQSGCGCAGKSRA